FQQSIGIRSCIATLHNKPISCTIGFMGTSKNSATSFPRKRESSQRENPLRSKDKSQGHVE
ncbi:MAG: hypothetical protein WAW75_12000, partial [Gallionella sp.]